MFYIIDYGRGSSEYHSEEKVVWRSPGHEGLQQRWELYHDAEADRLNQWPDMGALKVGATSPSTRVVRRGANVCSGARGGALGGAGWPFICVERRSGALGGALQWGQASSTREHI